MLEHICIIFHINMIQLWIRFELLDFWVNAVAESEGFWMNNLKIWEFMVFPCSKNLVYGLNPTLNRPSFSFGLVIFYFQLCRFKSFNFFPKSYFNSRNKKNPRSSTARLKQTFEKTTKFNLDQLNHKQTYAAIIKPNYHTFSHGFSLVR